MRTVPDDLQAHLDGGVTTVCRLLRFELRDGTKIGVTTLDKDVTYQGLTYSASKGYDSSVIASDTSYSVDNGEARALISTTLQGITKEMVLRGEMEGATWTMYLVNYMDLSMGHILLDAGDIGEVKLVRGLIYIPELLSYGMRLRANIGTNDSIDCRAEFGTPAASQRGCGVDTSGMWTNGTVAQVDVDEPKRTFQGDVSVTPPGVLEWLTGDNASSKLYDIEAEDSGTAAMALFEPTPFEISVGDTYRIRADCAKTWDACVAYGNELNFKGEPFIPIKEPSVRSL